MNTPEVSKVSKVSKAPSDTTTVKSVTPYRGTLTVTPRLTPGDCQSILTPRSVVALTLTPKPGNWRTPPLLRLRALLKAALRGYGWRCVSCRPVQPEASER
jgi:hypothetical protein